MVADVSATGDEYSQYAGSRKRQWLGWSFTKGASKVAVMLVVMTLVFFLDPKILNFSVTKLGNYLAWLQ